MHSSGNAQSAKTLSLRAQKKIIGSMANKNMAKLFIDDRSAHLLDMLHHLTRDYLNNKKRAEKLLKHCIKTAIKFALLVRNDQLTSPQLLLCSEFRRKLQLAAVTFISFYEVDYSFDKAYLGGIMRECGELLKRIAEAHLTAKSLQRIDDLFAFYGDGAWLEWLFLSNPRKDDLKAAVDDLHFLLKENVL